MQAPVTSRRGGGRCLRYGRADSRESRAWHVRATAHALVPHTTCAPSGQAYTRLWHPLTPVMCVLVSGLQASRVVCGMIGDCTWWVHVAFRPYRWSHVAPRYGIALRRRWTRRLFCARRRVVGVCGRGCAWRLAPCGLSRVAPPVSHVYAAGSICGNACRGAGVPRMAQPFWCDALVGPRPLRGTRTGPSRRFWFDRLADPARSCVSAYVLNVVSNVL